MPPPSDLQPTLDIKPMLNARSTPNVTSLATHLQAEVLCVCEPKSSDYILTNFFPS